MEKKSESTLKLWFCFITFCIFWVLKLTNNIDWSWWWVTSPLWIPTTFEVCLIIIAKVIARIYIFYKCKTDDVFKISYDLTKKTLKAHEERRNALKGRLEQLQKEREEMKQLIK